MTVDVFLSGEGANELGGRAGHPAYRDERPGVVEALLRAVRADGWRVAGARPWSKITKLRASGPTPKREGQNVLGLVLDAKRAGAHAVAFVRDADDDRERPRVIDEAIAQAGVDFPTIDVIGGTAVPVLEAWVLALQGEHRTEKLSRAASQTALARKGIAPKDTAAMVAVITEAGTRNLAPDATRLLKWLGDAGDVFRRRLGAPEPASTEAT